MNKKIIIISGVILLVLLLSFCFIYTFNTVRIDGTYFNVPNGYQIDDEGDYINLTSGTNYICLVKEVKNDDVNKLIKEYVNSKKVKENDTISVSSFKVDNLNVYKSISNNNDKTVHYWFVKYGKSYELFTWVANSNSDKIVSDLIKTMKPAELHII